MAAHDLHPDYAATAHALAMEGVETVGVQHHHAHLAAALAEHGERGPALGVIYDGTGYGTDGTVWGGELLAGDLVSFQRAGHLWPTRLPGGEAAVREPWRMACAWMLEALGEAPEPPPALRGQVDAERWRAVARLAAGGLASPVTTSAGRLFDAVAALAGVRAVVTHEGQAAVELEAAADDGENDAYDFAIADGLPASGEAGAAGLGAAATAAGAARRNAEVVEGGAAARVGAATADAEGAEASGPCPASGDLGTPLVLDPRPAIQQVLRDLERGTGAGRVSARFHGGLAAATVEACARLAGRHGLDTVVLSGGVFQNARLLEAVAAGLLARGLRPLVPSLLPPNDGGLAYGQAAVAAACLTARDA